MLSEHEYHPLPVARVVDETPDTRSFVLDVPPELESTFSYVAGQFCTFRAVIDGETVVRCYSMSSSPELDEPLTTTVKRVPGGRMSNWMNDHVAVGDRLDVLRPSGLFVLRDTDVPIFAFAGGSGITPVMSIVKTALATTSRAITLVDANRDTASVIFRDALERLEQGAGGRLTVQHHLDAERGFLDAVACEALVGDRAHADFYVCGPPPYMDVVTTGLSRAGVTHGQIFIERFETAAAPADAGERGTADGRAADAAIPESLTITLQQATRTVAYQPGDTILEGARRGGLNPPFSCEMGNCATCMAHLDEGSVRMRANNALTPEEVEEGWVLTCQSLPTSATIVVDYDA